MRITSGSVSSALRTTLGASGISLLYLIGVSGPALAAPVTASASVDIDGYLFDQDYPFGQVRVISEHPHSTDPEAVELQTSRTITAYGDTATWSVDSNAEDGLARVTASGSLISGSGPGELNIVVAEGMATPLTLHPTSPGVVQAGDKLRATGTLHLDGSFTGAASGLALASAYLVITHTGINLTGLHANSCGQGIAGIYRRGDGVLLGAYDCDSPPPSTIDWYMDMVPDVATPVATGLSLNLSLFTGLDPNDPENRAPGTASILANFGHTLTWGGVDSVTNLRTGELLTGWTLTSATGVDYSGSFSDLAAASEPGSLSLLPTGLGLAAYLRRRRSTRGEKTE